MATIPINDTSPRIAYTATAGQTVFPYPFWISAEEDVVVYQNGTVLILTTDYIVSDVLEPTGGNITFVAGASANDEIVIVRDIPVKRVSEFQTGGSFQASVLNSSLSKQVAMIQQVESNQERSLQLNASDTFTGSMNLPTVVADKYLKIDALGTGWEMASPPVVANTSLTISSGDAYKIVTVNSEEDDFDMLADLGTTGQLLTSTGSASAPIWQDAAGAGLVFISETVISSSPATVDITSGIDDTYDSYMVQLIDIIPATDNVNMLMRVSDDAGSTFKAGASDYNYHLNYSQPANTTYQSVASTGDTSMLLASQMGNTAVDGLSANIYLYKPSSATNYKYIVSDGIGNRQSIITRPSHSAGMYRGSTTAIDGIRFLFSSGNLSSGTIRLYGVAKS